MHRGIVARSPRSPATSPTQYLAGARRFCAARSKGEPLPCVKKIWATELPVLVQSSGTWRRPSPPLLASALQQPQLALDRLGGVAGRVVGDLRLHRGLTGGVLGLL